MAEGPEFSTPDGLFYSPLGAISPAEPSGDDVEGAYRAKVVRRRTAPSGDPGSESASTPTTASRIGADGSGIVGARPTGGDTVMSGPDDKPLLVLSRVDKGRVALLLERPDVALGARL